MGLPVLGGAPAPAAQPATGCVLDDTTWYERLGYRAGGGAVGLLIAFTLTHFAFHKKH